MEKALNVMYELRDAVSLSKNYPSDEILDEAISELEEAMKPKTCKGCKRSWEPNNQTFHRYFCEYLKIPIHGYFYCNRYEPKDNA